MKTSLRVGLLLVLLLLLVVALLLLFLPKKSQAPVTVASGDIAAVFLCSDNQSIQAIFHTAQDTVDLQLSDGRSLSLPRAMSGSGARYATPDEQFVFWNKGNTAFIQENGTTTYQDCVTTTSGG